MRLKSQLKSRICTGRGYAKVLLKSIGEIETLSLYIKSDWKNIY